MRQTDPPVLLAHSLSRADMINAPNVIAYKQSRNEEDYTQKLYVARVADCDTRAVFDEVRHSLNCSPAWSPDGAVLYHSHDQIVAINVATGAVRAVTNFREGEHANWHLICSPDGNTLAFLDFPPVDPETGRPIPHRLCTIGTDGRGFRVVMEQPEGQV